MRLVNVTKNPLNIRNSKRNKWVGQIKSYRGFCVFSSEYYGYRAAIVLLRNYIRNGCNTPRKIITRFAPPSENDTESYIYTCRYPWSEHYQLTTIEDICILLAGMAKIETGLQPTPESLIKIAKNEKISMCL